MTMSVRRIRLGSRTLVSGICASLVAASLAGVAPTPATAAPARSGTSTSATNPALADSGDFAHPPTAFRPMMRWWWAAPLTTEETLSGLREMKAAGFGGAEIAYDASSWATPAQRSTLAAAIAWAKDNDFQLDMTLGAAWPVRTPATDEASGEAELELQYGRADVAGGTTFAGAVPEAFDDVTDRSESLVAVTAAKVVTRGPEVTAVGEPPARSTVLDPTSLVDLTAQVTDGQLTWTAPAGDWIVFGFWSRATDGGLDGVANLFDADSIDAATAYIGEHQLGAGNAAALPGVGGAYFEDSLENNATSQYWTRDMLEQFEERRGYDLATHLPLVFMQDMSGYAFDFEHTGQPSTLPNADFTLPAGAGQRVLNDYWRTLDDLYAEEHVEPLVAWADQTGMQFRTQGAFGETLSTTRAAREIARAGGLMDDESLNAGGWVPDGVLSANEGSWRFMIDHYRSAVGGSHQGGQTQVSTELGAAIPAFETTMESYQRLMDTSWALGITRPIVHGFGYQTPGAAWPGTSRFGNIVAESWNPATFPQWDDWRALTDYWARGTYVLQSGTPRGDVAVLYDGFLTSAATPSLGASAPLPALFDGLSAETRGYQLQYVDSAGLAEPEAAGDGILYPDGPAYDALVIAQPTIDPAAAEAVAEQAERGLAVVIVGSAPSSSSSYGADPAAADARVTAAMARILAAPTTRRVAADSGMGAALDRLGVRPDTAWSTGEQLYAQHRETASSDVYYVYNPTDTAITTDVSFAATGTPRELDLWTGTTTTLAQYQSGAGRVVVPVDLGPGENVVLDFSKTPTARLHVVSADGADVAVTGARFAISDDAGGARTVSFSDGRSATVRLPQLPQPLDVDRWDLVVDETGPEADQPVHDLDDVELDDWRSVAALHDAAGVGTYTATLDLPRGWTAAGRGTRLSLGEISGGSVQVYVNGALASPAVTGIGDVDVTRLLRPGSNTIRVVFRSTLRNKATSLGIGTLLGPATQATGLLGPVRLTPYAVQQVAPPVPATKPTRISRIGQAPRVVTPGKRFTLRVWVRSPQGGQPTGVVRVLHHGTQIGTARLAGGVARVRVALPRGTRAPRPVVVLRYLGDERFGASRTSVRVTAHRAR